MAYTADRESRLVVTADHVDGLAGCTTDRLGERATVGRFAHGAGRHDANVTGAAVARALDVRLHHGEGAGHRRLAEGPGAREALTEPRDRLIVVDDLPRPGAGDVSHEKSDRVAADVDRGDAHRRK